jgi:hypothetical protein
VASIGYFLGGTLSPIGVTVSFLGTPMEEVRRALVSWREGLGQRIEQTGRAALPECARVLDPMEAPWTVELLIDCGRWTAYLNNDIAGGDPTAAAPALSQRMGCDCVVAMHAPPYGPGHAATQLWLMGPSGTPPLMYIRTIAASAEDGRWSWYQTGQVQPFEDPAQYKARRIRDRFNRQTLLAYLAALGIHADDAGFYGSGVGIRQITARPRRRETAAEVKARCGW